VQIQLAIVVYARQPSFQAFAEGAVPIAQVIDQIMKEAKVLALLPPHLREPAPTPDMGMSRAPTPLPPLPGEVQDSESQMTSVKSREEAGRDRVSIVPVS
jgi:hypothetical protein